MGPEGGDEGGMVVATGTPEEVAAVPAATPARSSPSWSRPAEPRVTRTRKPAAPKKPRAKAAAAA
jgi:excinuclease ABC subunit A